MLKKIGLALAVAIAGVLVFAATRPDSFHVERSAYIHAPPARIQPLLADFHRWQAWSPYEKLDPAMKREHSGAASGRGAVYAWEGKGGAGAGRMEITEATPEHLAIDLHFTKPMEGSDVAEFTLQPVGDSTRVTWAMHGPSPYVTKVMGVFFDMDHMIGRDFETGLANLKSIAEKP